ncbi:MAG: NUDIX hydrolase [Opitutaceae bacterium]|nr:NUDIX hydrolase [Opitutaceae bacterium]
MSLPHRISAGALVIHANRVLLVQHRIPGHDDFWGPPGGGVEGKETLFDCAARECFEETGLQVQPLKFVYIEELFDAGRRVCKHWIQCKLIGGEINFQHATEEERDVLLEARFVSRSEIASLNVFPRLMRDQFWQDLAAGFPTVRYIGFEN